MAPVTHRINVIDGGRGFFSLCKSALQKLCEIHRDHLSARCAIVIREPLYAPKADLYQTYFVPRFDGEGGEEVTGRDHPDCGMVRDMRQWMRDGAFALAGAYFRPRPDLEDRIREVCGRLGDSPIGVHYRGNDKHRESRVYSLDTYKRQLDTLVRCMRPSAVFLATDEAQAVRELSSVGPVVALDHLRSDDDVGKGIHRRKWDPLRLGNEAVVDAYVLSRCAMMLSGVSNLPDWAAILTPDMPWVRIV